MAPGYRLPAKDIARINRVVTAFEAGPGAAPVPDPRVRGPQLTRWMLNERFHPRDDDDADFQPESAFGSRFVAQALQCQPTRLRVQLLRVKNLDAPGPSPFRISFDGATTDELHDDVTAAALQSGLEALPGLSNQVAVIGHQTTIGTTTYQPRQWHLLYADDLQATTLPELSSGSNFRLFRDWWLPTPVVDVVWTGLPNDAALEPGAFGFCYPFDVAGWTWIHGECLTKS